VPSGKLHKLEEERGSQANVVLGQAGETISPTPPLASPFNLQVKRTLTSSRQDVLQHTASSKLLVHLGAPCFTAPARMRTILSSGLFFLKPTNFSSPEVTSCSRRCDLYENTPRQPAQHVLHTGVADCAWRIALL